jgi:phage host-nuclease inhibitor protein Gam
MEYIAKDIEELHYNWADDELNPEPVDESKADAILYCIGREQSRMNDVHEQAKKQIDKIKFWEEVQAGKYQKVIDNMTVRLQSYFIGLVAIDPSLKTKSMVNGTMKVRKMQPLVHVDDKDAFLKNLGPDQHLKDGTELFRVSTKYEPDKKAILSYVKDTGDIPDGIVVESRDDKFSITIKEG